MNNKILEKINKDFIKLDYEIKKENNNEIIESYFYILNNKILSNYYKYFFKSRIFSVNCFFITKDNYFLYGKNNLWINNYKFLIGGKIKNNDKNIYSTLTREIFEELNIKKYYFTIIRNFFIIRIIYDKNINKYFFNITFLIKCILTKDNILDLFQKSYDIHELVFIKREEKINKNELLQ